MAMPTSTPAPHDKDPPLHDVADLRDAAAKPMGNVQSLLHRRLRALQKRSAKIERAVAKERDGGEIDDQQRELVAGAALTTSMLDEMTKLFDQCVGAIAADVRDAVADAKAREIATAREAIERLEKTSRDERRDAEARETRRERDEKRRAKEREGALRALEKRCEAAEKAARAANDRAAAAERALADAAAAAAAAAEKAKKATIARDPLPKRPNDADAVAAAVEDATREIITLLYYANAFDLSLPDVPPFSHALEREAALSYHADPRCRTHRSVTAEDLDALVALARAATTRAAADVGDGATQTQMMSHAEAIERCVALATSWVSSTNALPAPAWTSRARGVVDAVRGSGWNTLRPVMHGVGDVGGADGGDAMPMPPAAARQTGHHLAGGGREEKEGEDRASARPRARERERKPPAAAAAARSNGASPGTVLAAAPGQPAPEAFFSGMGGMGFLDMVQRQQQQQQQQRQGQQRGQRWRRPRRDEFAPPPRGFSPPARVPTPPPLLPTLSTVSSMDQYGFVAAISEGGDEHVGEGVGKKTAKRGGGGGKGEKRNANANANAARRGGGGGGGGGERAAVPAPAVPAPVVARTTTAPPGPGGGEKRKERGDRNGGGGRGGRGGGGEKKTARGGGGGGGGGGGRGGRGGERK